MLFPNIASKLFPVIVTAVPTGPLVGVKEVMVGDCAKPLNDNDRIEQKVISRSVAVKDSGLINN
jgi:hypothetical protein